MRTPAPDILVGVSGGLPPAVRLLMNENLGAELQDFISPAVLDSPTETVQRYQAEIQDRQSPLVIHGPVYDLSPFSPDPAVIELTRHRYRQALELASRLGARALVLHSQYDPRLSFGRLSELVDRQVEFWHELTVLSHSLPAPVTLLLENVFDDSPRFLASLFDATGPDGPGFCLDVGHAQAFSNANLEEWMSCAGERLSYIHLHESDASGSRRHRPPSQERLEAIVGAMIETGTRVDSICLEYAVDDLQAECVRLRGLFDGLGEPGAVHSNRGSPSDQHG